MSKKRKAKKIIEAAKKSGEEKMPPPVEESKETEEVAVELETQEEPVVPEPIDEETQEEPKEPTALDVHRQHIATVKEIARDKKTVGAKCILGIVNEEKKRAKDDRIVKVERNASRDHNV